ncbi:ribose-phosphate diphosphokinase [Candidatus Neptunochlamydia vexilliferae]|uniref:ribose-phosphate diphosphokinase n=1 Tax=Candidatus Neptunichlamydia vexilliferae TaxID=1651774 RepID=UPI002A4E2029|nr:ribose-phosphate pyrophosphokinase [Candidatus Neptunochlamydia vexilliferae]
MRRFESSHPKYGAVDAAAPEHLSVFMAEPFMLFSGTSHPTLSEEIGKSLGVSLGKTEIELFPDGEIGVQILENVRGRDVFVVQSIAKQPNLYLMELLILIDALKRASARGIIAVIPYFGYARQDRKDRGRVPITAKLVANLLETAGATRVIAMDLHSEQIQGFFDIPVDHLYAHTVFAKKVKELGLENLTVCAPDVGSAKLARILATEVEGDFAMVDKRRIGASAIEAGALLGDVQGRNVILVDDISSTGQTLKRAAEVCKKAGAAKVFAAVTHPLFSEEALKGAPIDQLFVTNTIPMAQEIAGPQVEVLSVAGIFGKAIECIVENASVSSLFRSRT